MCDQYLYTRARLELCPGLRHSLVVNNIALVLWITKNGSTDFRPTTLQSLLQISLATNFMTAKKSFFSLNVLAKLIQLFNMRLTNLWWTKIFSSVDSSYSGQYQQWTHYVINFMRNKTLRDLQHTVGKNRFAGSVQNDILLATQ